MVSDIDLALHVNTDAGEKDFGVKGEYAFGMIPVGGINLRKPGRCVGVCLRHDRLCGVVQPNPMPGLRPRHFSFQSLGKASFPRAFHEKCPSRGIGFGWRRERDSNPRRLAPQRFSRPPQSTTLPSLHGKNSPCKGFGQIMAGISLR